MRRKSNERGVGDVARLGSSACLVAVGLSFALPCHGGVFSIVDPAHPDRVKVGEVEGWQVQEVDVLAFAKSYSDPLSATVAKWDEGRFALAKAREIAEDFELVDGKVPARVRAAGRACLPISVGRLCC